MLVDLALEELIARCNSLQLVKLLLELLLVEDEQLR